ncbi:MAG: GNAT family N-acetyltransferase [Candidatus Promineifilaceae bacterium]
MVTFEQITLAESHPAICRHLEHGLSAPIESFLEDHVVASTHYQMLIAGEVAGFASVYDGRLLTQFMVASRFRPKSTQLFTAARQLESVNTAFVPTCDELFLSQALDASTKVEKQAYFWQVGEGVISAENPLTRATSADLDLIIQHTGDFFDDPSTLIKRGDLFISHRNNEIAGYGLIERSRFYLATGSIGMFVVEKHRQQGVGTDIIRALIHECRRQTLRVVAGCYYFNHASRNTLLKAGMYAQTRLLKIHF